MKDPANPPTIAVFDSGVGGLSILAEALRLLPGCRFDYLCDNAGFPYGTRADKFIIQRSQRVIETYFQQCQMMPDMLVVACNTASTLALPHLRATFDLPIIGVVPAIKPAAAYSRTGVIGLLATPATTKRAYTQKLINDYAADCQVISQGSSNLVVMAENKLRGLPPDLSLLAEELKIFTQVSALNPHPEKLDCLVLACTHFPLLEEEIQACLGPQVQLLDSGKAIAKRIHYWCDQLGYSCHQETSRVLEGTAWFSAKDPELETMKPCLNPLQLTRVSYLANLDDL